MLRGANLSGETKWRDDKLPPLDPTVLEVLRDDLGMNAVRLLVFWQAIEPFPGIYDATYLDAVKAWVDRAGDEGLHVIVDMHQDVFGEGFGHGGAPRWACEESLYATYEEPEPWFMGYLEPEVTACFDDLYARGSTRASFAAAWSRLAETLSESPVFAYELLNEPFWGSASAPTFDSAVAPRFYRELIDVIRAEDRRPYVAIQPSVTASVGVPTELPAIGRRRVLYAPHFYPPDVELGRGYDGRQAVLESMTSVLCADAKRLRAPLVIGEAGARRSSQGLVPYLRDLYDVLDAAQASVLYWDLSRGGNEGYGLLDKEGKPSLQGRLVARPYPMRTAGRLSSFEYDTNNGVFTASWNESGAARGDTIVSLPRLAYPFGTDVTVRPPSITVKEGSRLHIERIGGRRDLVVRPRVSEEQAAR